MSKSLVALSQKGSMIMHALASRLTSRRAIAGLTSAVALGIGSASSRMPCGGYRE